MLNLDGDINIYIYIYDEYIMNIYIERERLLVLSSFTGFLYFLPNILPRIVGNHLIALNN